MTITYQGLDITQPIQGEIQPAAFSVNLLNAGTAQATILAEEQEAQFKFETERRELQAKIISEQDAAIKAELQAQLDELDTKERERHNENVANELAEQYMQERDAKFEKVKMGAAVVIVLVIVVIVAVIFKNKSKQKKSGN